MTPADLGTCALSDALDALGLPGVLPGVRALSGSARVAGRAVTVTLGPAGSAPAGRHLCTAAVDAAGPGDVVVVAHPGGDAAGWGGILSLAAHRRGIEGVVIGGPARDVDEARALGFAVFGTAATPVTARGRIAEIAWNEPIAIGPVLVAPGDLVVGDENGVVVVPATRRTEVLGRAAAIVEREAAIAAAVRSGTPVAEAMGASYERMLS
ncbi:Regulator of RNase E activity RraA [Pseudonocardia thermophila]|uniref:Putative 4-hydroxy-4-methyl-2-oxoglutarate aldolase n=1 Tax=Pseudonocardia thermophila TaxID=1848 RepID=A0A1M6UGK5_PSETH|nr:hypothetical protein [Pseudonocardia thermophila]SHK68309.1 Regulator of RNase E activity RraA [Pseudonocardia thermophila]